jgi:hypothetical protein
MPLENDTATGPGTLTLTREERNALQNALIVDLVELSDGLNLDGDFGTKLPVEPEMRDALRLLDDLGWEPEDTAESYAITMDQEPLIATLSRLAATAEASLRAGYDPEYADEDLDCWATCRRLLQHLDEIDSYQALTAANFSS